MGISDCIQDTNWDVPDRMVYGKVCHLPVELEYKAYWAIRLLNFDMQLAGEKDVAT